MDIRVIAGNITQIEADAVVVNLFEGVSSPGGGTGAVDAALGGAISQLIAGGDIKGKLNETTLIHTFGRLPAPRVLVVGLGKSADFTLERVRQVSGTAAKALRRVGASRISTIVHGAGIAGLDPEASAQAVAEGTLLGLYTFNRYKKADPDRREVAELLIVERDAAKVAVFERGVATGRIIADATNYARDMINAPGRDLTPTDMARLATESARELGLDIEVFDRDQMVELGMGGLLGVARGSEEPPQFIVLHYRGADPAAAPVAFVGKGITFDSGGISIKPADGMDEMKTDMSGGAAVIGAMRAIAQLKPRLNIIGVAPATENMPSGTALKPGDIIRPMSGKTIEVVNTDAEGRLILADGLAYARQQGATAIIDLATLTGACTVALGHACSGGMTNNQALFDKVVAAGEAAGERIWQLPMYDDYDEQIKSDVADMKNTGGRPAGTITAAKLLAEFAEDTPWVHLDIAGTARADKEQPYIPKGGSGVGVRTLINLALALAQEGS